MCITKFQDVWRPLIGELTEDNPKDHYAFAVSSKTMYVATGVVGYVSHYLSTPCSLFIRQSGM